MNLQSLKRTFFRTLIACLIAAAGLAVVTVLLGKFGGASTKALFTIIAVALHSLIAISFIENNEKQQTFESLNFFTNATFVIVILSFVTSVFGIWGLFPAMLIWRLYEAYFVVLFAILHAEVLIKAVKKQASLQGLVSANLFFMSIVVTMLLIVIMVPAQITLPSAYYRILAATGIVDATLTIITVIQHSLFIQKNPQLRDPVFNVQLVQVPGQPGQVMQVNVPVQKRRTNIFVLILGAFVGIQVIWAVIALILIG